MNIIVDTGPLVALIDPDTKEHAWVHDHAKVLPRPLVTSEPVLTEAAFLLTRDGFDADELFALADAGVITVWWRTCGIWPNKTIRSGKPRSDVAWTIASPARVAPLKSF